MHAVRRLLGKKKPSNDPRNLQFAKYVRAAALPPAPSTLDWTGIIQSWPMMKNDTVGDCTFAAAGHLIQSWTAHTGRLYIPSDADLIKGYSAVTAQENNGKGYDPKTGDNDNGCVETDVLNYWRQTGISGRKILAYMAVNPKDYYHMRLAIMLFGGLYTGIDLPLTAQTQVEQNQPWTVTWPLKGNAAAGSWGGHAVPIMAFDPTWLTCITWGAKQKMSKNWWYNYGDECYAIVTQDWLNAQGKSPAGFDVTALLADLSAIGHAA